MLAFHFAVGPLSGSVDIFVSLVFVFNLKKNTHTRVVVGTYDKVLNV